MNVLGWDPGMKQRCVQTVDPGGVNGYSDMRDDDGSGRHRTLAYGCEVVYQEEIGPVNQGLPIDGKALSFDWVGAPGGYAAHLTADFYHHSSPAANSFNWYSLMDSGELGHSLDITTTFNIAADWWMPAAYFRVSVSGLFWWDGAPHLLDINLAISDDWGTANPKTDDIVGWLPFGGNGEYVGVRGSGWGLTIPKAKTTAITIDWARAIQTLCQRWDVNRGTHFFAPPSNWHEAEPGGIGVCMEILTPVRTQAGIVGLWVGGLYTGAK